MKLKFKQQRFQTEAVEAVVDCLQGQPAGAPLRYRIDPGSRGRGPGQLHVEVGADGFANPPIALAPEAVLHNIRMVQRRGHLPESTRIVSSHAAPFNFDIEMETGTGKTYTYIKTMFELHRRYNFAKFIVVVPSIAIREGVYKTFQMTADHFHEQYGMRARVFIYNSRELHRLESFSSDAGLNVMIINVQAFNATGQDARRIYEVLDEFQSRRPIDVLAANRPILILDEPQKMEGKRTLEGLARFGAPLALRYSATHRTEHNKVYRLDAIDAYNQKLVKKIAVRGITVRGLTGTNAYLYLDSIEVFKDRPPEARLELEMRTRSGIRRVLRRVRRGDKLFDLSRGLDQYKGFAVTDVDAADNVVRFRNGVEVAGGQAVGDVNEATLRRIQIREAITAHFDKERRLLGQGIKVLTLFFIDEVAKYRDYSQHDEKGEYARIFEEEYDALRRQYAEEFPDEVRWHAFVNRTNPGDVHEGYFSIDRRTKRLTDPNVRKRGPEAGLSDDVDAYELILKDKERLLSLNEPVRFIFSHSALREGWDNPNVFVICTLKHSDSTVSRRQEVGRGLRLAVNQNGERIDDPAVVHDVNVLTVVANESYKDFVEGLQKDIAASLSARPRVANEQYFTGKLLRTDQGEVAVDARMARLITRYLIRNDYSDEDDRITQKYHDDAAGGTLAPLPEELGTMAGAVHELIRTVFSEAQMPAMEDAGRVRVHNPLNSNFEKREFQELWRRINRKAVYTVNFDTGELIDKCVAALNAELKVASLQYYVIAGEQADRVTEEAVKKGRSFRSRESSVQSPATKELGEVAYDLVGKLSEMTMLTRSTVATVLQRIDREVFARFRVNPEQFIQEAARLINEQKATVIVQHLTYDATGDTYGVDIFTQEKRGEDFSQAFKAERHIFDYVFTEGDSEREFVEALDKSAEVVVYAKLPRGFFIPTPVGNYNPDWAIAFQHGKVRHVYFIAETKGALSSMQFRAVEQAKIASARKFFAKITSDQVKYDVVDSFGRLMDVVQGA